MRKKDHTVYVTEEIRKIPVIYLLDLEMSALDRLEKMVRDEVKRTSLALEWIQGIKNIKKASKDGGKKKKKNILCFVSGRFPCGCA